MDNDTVHYVCHYPNCGKQFTNSISLALHITEVHEGTYKCDLCPATFYDSRLFGLHKRETHGENPYVCEICKKSFRTRRELNRHRVVHSDEKSHVCWVCFRAYKREDTLNRHVETEVIYDITNKKNNKRTRYK
ncbi:PREDICTED: zinc finger protein 732-like [Acromyrmex echinatior]|uniref:zinc finger protein 732-like n=1 Tax=Acromyrmex echinatior TaxID=103372 RepID=UPI0005810378|nr:PREDICTED: zinc finger protein 732-like [Acromyrmex echinatior]